MQRLPIRRFVLIKPLGFICLTLLLFTCSSCSQSFSSSLKSAHLNSDIKIFEDVQGNKLKVRITEPIAKGVHLAKGVNLQTGEAIILKKVEFKEAKANRLLTKYIAEHKTSHPEAKIFDQILAGKIYKSALSEFPDYSILVLPYIEGKIYPEYYNLLTNYPTDEPYDVRGKGEDLLNRALEVGEIVKAFYSLGYTNSDINKSNLLIREEDALLFMIDFDRVDSLGDINAIKKNFIDILYLLYPYGGKISNFKDLKESTIDLIFTDNEELNIQLNWMLDDIVRKINDYSYVFDKEIYDDNLISRNNAKRAMDEFLFDIKQVLVTLQTGQGKTPSDKLAALSKDQVKKFYSLMQQGGRHPLEFIDVFDKDSVADRTMRMTLLRIPIGEHSQQDLIILSPDFNFTQFSQIQLPSAAASFFYDTKNGVTITYSDEVFDDLDMRRKLIQYLKNSSIKKKSYHFVKINDPFPLMFSKKNDSFPKFQMKSSIGGVPSYQQGDVIEYINGKKEHRRIRYQNSIAKRVRIFKGVDEDTKEEFAVKRVTPYEAKMHEYIRAIKNRNDLSGEDRSRLSQVVTGAVYKRTPLGIDRFDQVMMPFVEGGTFQAHYESAELYPKHHDNRIQQMQKVIEIGRIVKTLYGFGLYIDGLGPTNIMLTKDELQPVIVDLGDIFKLQRESQVNYNLLTLFKLSFPDLMSFTMYTAFISMLIDRTDEHVDRKIFLSHLDLLLKNETNDTVQKIMKKILKDISGGAYLQRSDPFSENAVFPKRAQIAIQSFLEDMEILLDAIHSNPPKFSEREISKNLLTFRNGDILVFFDDEEIKISIRYLEKIDQKGHSFKGQNIRNGQFVLIRWVNNDEAKDRAMQNKKYMLIKWDYYKFGFFSMELLVEDNKVH